MNIRKRILLLFGVMALIGIAVFSVFLVQGYILYQETLQDVSVTDTIDHVRENESFVPLEDLPQFYLDAVIAVEDHRFYEHGPIDLIAILRAVISNIREMGPAAGGSTITQQVAKNLFFTQEKVMTRKFSELFMAYDLEGKYSKKEILEIYVNTIFFGNGFHGIREAALGYYGVEPSKMSLDQATMLAGIPNAPSAYALNKNPDLAKQRQGQVIREMIKYQYLTQIEADELLQ